MFSFILKTYINTVNRNSFCTVVRYLKSSSVAFSPKMPNFIPSELTLCRLMQPGDANIAGNVHGGTILKLIEEAGMIVSTRYCNQNRLEKESSICGLVRVEKTDFLQPMFVGEISHLSAEVTYCSVHSLEVKVMVFAENLFKGIMRKTNEATLWYVPMRSNDQLGTVPKMEYKTATDETAGRERYNRQKEDRKKINLHIPTLNDSWAMCLDIASQNKEMYTVERAQSTLIHGVQVTDCGVHGKVTGGCIMKLMDEVAGICSARHCHSSVVTASMDTVNFHRSVNKGSLLHLRSRPIFTSNKSILIQVIVLVEERNRDHTTSTEINVFCACTAYFTFVSLDKSGKTQKIPPLKIVTAEEKERFDEGKERYEFEKQSRKAAL